MITVVKWPQQCIWAAELSFLLGLQLGHSGVMYFQLKCGELPTPLLTYNYWAFGRPTAGF